ncbi:Lipoprotein [uncultured Thiomicrorhabdus sp.]
MKAPFLFALGLLTAFSTGCVSNNSTQQTLVKSSENARVTTDDIDKLVNKKAVYIGNFGVTFVVQDSSSSKAESPMIRHNSGDYAKAHLVAKLSGVSDNTFQAITDQAYNTFVKDLEEKGYQVKNYADLQTNNLFKTMTKLSTPHFPSHQGLFQKMKGSKNMIAFAPSNMSLIYNFDAPYLGKFGELAEQLKTPVLSVNYKVHFAYFDKDADYKVDYIESVPLGSKSPQKTANLSASVSLGQGIQVVSGSKLIVMQDNGGTFNRNSSVTLKDPVVAIGAYGRNKDTSSDATKAANALSSALGMFSGRSSSTTEISITAEPKYYEFGANKVLNEATNRLVKALPMQN